MFEIGFLKSIWCFFLTFKTQIFHASENAYLNLIFREERLSFHAHMKKNQALYGETNTVKSEKFLMFIM